MLNCCFQNVEGLLSYLVSINCTAKICYNISVRCIWIPKKHRTRRQPAGPDLNLTFFTRERSLHYDNLSIFNMYLFYLLGLRSRWLSLRPGWSRSSSEFYSRPPSVRRAVRPRGWLVDATRATLVRTRRDRILSTGRSDCCSRLVVRPELSSRDLQFVNKSVLYFDHPTEKRDVICLKS